MSKKTKPIPNFASEAEERTFWETHDSTEYIEWERATRARLPSTKSISLRLPVSLLEPRKIAANKRDVSYSR